MECSFDPNFSVDSNVILLSSATEASKPGSVISIHSSSCIDKSSMLEGETDKERSGDLLI